MRRRDLLLSASGLLVGALALPVFAQAPSDALLAAVADPARSPQNRARDRYRHPAATLAFWGVTPNMTVVEVEPSGGYWTEILAPYLKKGGGRYIAAVGGDPAKFTARFADAALWGDITVTKLFAGPIAPTGSADLVITARNIHDWLSPPGRLETALDEFNAALRPGGLLGVEEHRADPRAMLPGASDGYVATRWLVDAVDKAGFALAARSEINANPKDTKTYPFGVWTLPPTLRSHAKGEPVPADYDAAKYVAIGESDRMTLRFRKVRQA
jgi:predicted methyltransferase